MGNENLEVGKELSKLKKQKIKCKQDIEEITGNIWV